MIETSRLLLRDFCKSDWKEVHEYARDVEVSRYMEWGPNTAEDTVAFVDTALLHQKDRPRLSYELAVILKESEKLIGSGGIRIITRDLEQAEIGYTFNRAFWRQGFGSETCRSLIDFGFEKLKLHRVFATCDADNHGSAGVLRKSGMRLEGHFLKDKKIKGRWRDTLLFAVLKEEWLDARTT